MNEFTRYLVVMTPDTALDAGSILYVNAAFCRMTGYAFEEVTTRPHPDHVRSFERARPNQLWQTDLFTFVLKR